MDSYLLIIYILFLHFVSDFIFQSREVAVTKSKSVLSLSIHCLTYSFGLLLGMVFIDFQYMIPFTFINGLSHFIVDFITSRLTTKFYQEDKMHQFWIVIGADQFIHSTILILSIELLI